MFEPVEVNLSHDEPSVDTIQQFYVSVNTDQKFDLLLLLLKRDRPRQCIVFTRTKRGADRLADRLHRVIKGVSAIHGDLPQSTRDRVMKGFRSGQISVLVATDVVGRGIDVEGISHVINYDMPDDAENYVHRIGRTGRMGKDGVAYLFVCHDQGEPLTAIESLINRVIPPIAGRRFREAPSQDRAGGPRAVQHRRDSVPCPRHALTAAPARPFLTRPRASKSLRASSSNWQALHPTNWSSRHKVSTSHRVASSPAAVGKLLGVGQPHDTLTGLVGGQNADRIAGSQQKVMGQDFVDPPGGDLGSRLSVRGITTRQIPGRKRSGKEIPDLGSLIRNPVSLFSLTRAIGRRAGPVCKPWSLPSPTQLSGCLLRKPPRPVRARRDRTVRPLPQPPPDDVDREQQDRQRHERPGDLSRLAQTVEGGS